MGSERRLALSGPHGGHVRPQLAERALGRHFAQRVTVRLGFTTVVDRSVNW